MATKKIILITGASDGIGLESSYAIANASPSNHVIMGCRSLEKGKKALEQVQARKPAGTVSLVELDVTNDSTIKAAADKITADFGVLDVLINNAGVFPAGTKENRRAEMMQAFNTNTIGPMVLFDSLEPLLQKSGNPRIINVSSVLGSINNRLNPQWEHYNVLGEPYRISKAGLNMASACMLKYSKQWGGKVWTYCPGYVLTNIRGEGDRQRRIDTGAESVETSAEGLLEIIQGKRDGEMGLFLERRGKVSPW
ncbi:short chain dehydrogenase [Hirsutella rhossiliensis]|uniref:Short chain dehydrogenase domain-containing protein n=1 Tax=Hirsutella rhossiliensis TaxID=111463 RepID=A0A9P8SK97_9HYPO|nr:short chain dehydrogenase domain-containing protein [Hirsutella rhossiliensis]KAH0966123.1 short chain dehydrogenase domain-containing protein [Hirsutella rhossiliensis]